MRNILTVWNSQLKYIRSYQSLCLSKDDLSSERLLHCLFIGNDIVLKVSAKINLNHLKDEIRHIITKSQKLYTGCF